MSESSSSKETHARLVRRQKFSSLLPIGVLILLDSPTSIPSIEEVPCVS